MKSSKEITVLSPRPLSARMASRLKPIRVIGRNSQQQGKIGWALLWLLGVPLPVLLILYLIFRH